MSNKKILWGAIAIFTIAVTFTIVYIKRSDPAAAGQAGDSFNGLLAPFISFAAALLVYFSFREQIVANKLITTQWQFEKTLEILNDIKRSFEKIESHNYFDIGSPTKYGSDALAEIIAKDPDEHEVAINKQFKRLEHILIEMQFLINRVKILEEEDKRYIWVKIDIFYEEALNKNLNKYRINYNRKFWKSTEARDLYSEINKFKLLFNERY